MASGGVTSASGFCFASSASDRQRVYRQTIWLCGSLFGYAARAIRIASKIPWHRSCSCTPIISNSDGDACWLRDSKFSALSDRQTAGQTACCSYYKSTVSSVGALWFDASHIVHRSLVYFVD